VRTYGYDANGNRTSLTGPGLSVSGTYDAQDRILTYGSASYSHDRDGFLSEKVVGNDTTRYVYDALGNLLRVTLPGGTAIEYVLDGESRRVGRKVNGVLQQGWLWQSDLAPAAELDGSGAVVSRFVHGTRPNVPDYLVKGGVTYRLVLDQLGSVRLVVNTTDGTVAQRIDYDEFGRVTQNTNPGFQPFGFAGGLNDDQTGLVRFGARDYDPVTGQWTAKEPLGLAGGDANLYAYAGNDPVTSIDPTGEFAIPPAVGFIGGCALSAGLESVLRQALGPKNCVDLGQVGLEALQGAGVCAALGGLGWAGMRGFQAFRAAGVARLPGGLEKASNAAFRAAKNVFVKAKHMANARGWASKFAPGVDAHAAVREALTSPNALFLTNQKDPRRFRVVTDLGRVIGSAGQTTIRAVVDFSGNLITAFPVKFR